LSRGRATVRPRYLGTGSDVRGYWGQVHLQADVLPATEKHTRNTPERHQTSSKHHKHRINAFYVWVFSISSINILNFNPNVKILAIVIIGWRLRILIELIENGQTYKAFICFF
jgi:hypothetical protein